MCCNKITAGFIFPRNCPLILLPVTLCLDQVQLTTPEAVAIPDSPKKDTAEEAVQDEEPRIIHLPPGTSEEEIEGEEAERISLNPKHIKVEVEVEEGEVEEVEGGESESVSPKPGSKPVTMEETELEVNDEGYNDIDE